MGDVDTELHEEWGEGGSDAGCSVDRFVNKEYRLYNVTETRLMSRGNIN